MESETIFRTFFILAFIVMTAVRVYYQSKILRDKREVHIQEGRISLTAGSLAALTTIVFGAEYLFSPGFFRFAYLLPYPNWLRWLGALALALGTGLLWSAHHHLGKSFHSLVVSKDEQTLVETGPYRWVRHPIYTAYLVSYVSGGLLAGNLVLTFVPAAFYAVLVAIRLKEEEKVLVELFGRKYREYQKRTGRLLPRIFERQSDQSG